MLTDKLLDHASILKYEDTFLVDYFILDPLILEENAKVADRQGFIDEER